MLKDFYFYFQNASRNSLGAGKPPSLTAQLLLLYYLVLYEDVRLANAHAHAQAGVSPRSYSTEFLAKLPIKHLLQQAQRDQHSYAGLFSPLLRLLATHFPHLSLVDDWLDEEPALDLVHNQRDNIELTAFSVDCGMLDRVSSLVHLVFLLFCYLTIVVLILQPLTISPRTLPIWPVF